jgi:hypothetical protein
MAGRDAFWPWEFPLRAWHRRVGLSGRRLKVAGNILVQPLNRHARARAQPDQPLRLHFLPVTPLTLPCTHDNLYNQRSRSRKAKTHEANHEFS